MSEEHRNKTSDARWNVIEEWMRMVLDTGGIERYDDLHIDRIDPTWQNRDSWLRGSSDALALAKELKKSIASDKTLVIMCSLASEGRKLACPGSPTELAEQIDWTTPPSLYLFEPTNEPWADLERVTVTPMVPLFPACSECFVMQFKHEASNELRRTFVAVS